MIFRFKRVVFFSILTFILSSCFNQTGCKKVTILKQELNWFTHYSHGDTIYFKNELNEVDTFIVEVMKEPDYTDCNKFELGEYIYPSISLRFKCLDNYAIEQRRKNYFLEFYKSIEDSSAQVCKKGISFFELDVANFTDFNSFRKKQVKYPNTKDSTDIFIFEQRISAINNEGIVNLMSEFAVTETFGLVWYKTINGSLYERVW